MQTVIDVYYFKINSVYTWIVPTLDLPKNVVFIAYTMNIFMLCFKLVSFNKNVLAALVGRANAFKIDGVE